MAPSRLRLARPKPRPSSSFVRAGKRTGIVVPAGIALPPPGTSLREWLARGGRLPRRVPDRVPAFALFDPPPSAFRRRRPAARSEPRITLLDGLSRRPPLSQRRPPGAGAMNATRLDLRLKALAAALDDLPAQARRLARWRANRARERERSAHLWTDIRPDGTAVRREPPVRYRRVGKWLRPVRTSPLRPGRPPGSRRRPDHEIHGLLAELHAQAVQVLAHDTS